MHPSGLTPAWWGEPNMAENKYVVFKVADELYSLPIEDVERILPEEPVTRLPRTPKMFMGIFDLRGQTVPTIDLRLRFELEPSVESGNFVVVQTRDGRCAWRVDSVDGIVTLQEKDVDDSPEIFDRKGDDFMAGIGKQGDRLMVMLDVNEVIPKTMRNNLKLASEMSIDDAKAKKAKAA